MDYGLKDKVVLVTGSTKGLGKAIAELIAQEGGIPVVTGRREKEVHEIMMELREKYQDERIQGYCVDFSELSSVDFIFDVIKKDLGSIDVLINNAGIWPTAYVVDMKPDDSCEFRNTIFAVSEICAGKDSCSAERKDC